MNQNNRMFGRSHLRRKRHHRVHNHLRLLSMETPPNRRLALSHLLGYLKVVAMPLTAQQGAVQIEFPKTLRGGRPGNRLLRDNQISSNDINTSWKKNGLVRAMIFQRKLYIIETKHDGGGYNVRRGLAILGSIHRAIVVFKPQFPTSNLHSP